MALFSCTSHLTDIGGIGFGPDGTDVFMEGIYIPFLKLADKGVMNETLMAIIRQNTRLPIESEGDVYSLAACNDIGCKRLSEMMTEFGIDSLDPRRIHHRQLLPRGDAGDRQAAQRRVQEFDDHRWLRQADRSLRDDHDFRQGHPRRLRRHEHRLALRHQRAACLHHGLHLLRPRLRRRARHSQQRWLAGAR